MGKRLKITLLLCLASLCLPAQETQDSTYIQKDIIRVFGCFAFDYMIQQETWDYRFHGFIEYFPEKHVSLIGEYYHYIDTKLDVPVITWNRAIGIGAAYHWPKKNIDPYIFLLSTGNFYKTQIVYSPDSILETPLEPNPGFAIGAGLTLYAKKVVNFFVQVRYHHAFQYNSLHIVKLDAFSVSYGLGFHFLAKKKKKTVIL